MAAAPRTDAPAARLPRAWRQPALALLLLLAGVAWLYRETLATMITIWSRSDTYTHAFLVLPIVLWLLWRGRGRLAARRPGAAPWLLLPMAAAALLWLLGELATVNAATQFGMMGLAVLGVAAVVGLPATRAMLFPLAFLFFAVPFGDFLLPWMMDWTADFTVAALRLTGIPVYREGLFFVIPSGTWSVVEACSGVRYLIASLMVGVLFAYLNYRSLRRRLVFVGVALLVPVVANWLRAYLIVLLGHVTDNRLAAGVDHLVYGWVFFGLIMVLMFAIGARWAEPAGPPPPPPAAPPRTPGTPWPVAAGAALLAVLPHAALWAINGVPDGPAPYLPAPQLAGWRAEAGEPADWTPAFEGAAATLQRTYADPAGRPVGLYVAYYRNQAPGRKLVSSENRLIAYQDKAWHQVGGGRRELAVGGETLTVRTARLRGTALLGTATPQIAVWQMYWVNGTLTASDPWAKLAGALHRLLGRGDDAAAIVVYARGDVPGGPEAALESFLRDNLPALRAHLSRTRDGRADASNDKGLGRPH